jgi:SAM-dependent methyltransferase
VANVDEIRTETRDAAGRRTPYRDQAFWETRALSFSGYAVQTRYAEGFLKLMEVQPEWTVFDMACGGGTLAIPLAAKVRRVTAVDFSKNMLSIVERRCRENGIANIVTILGRWEDDWKALGIGEHDIAIASRSLHEENASRCIQKLNEVAKRQVWISAAVGHGPFDARLCEFAGRTCEIGSEYIYYYNILHRLGIRANVAFVEENHRNGWETREEAFEDQRWMFHGMTSDEEERVKQYLDQNLIRQNGQWRLPYERRCHWAVMWWIKE